MFTRKITYVFRFVFEMEGCFADQSFSFCFSPVEHDLHVLINTIWYSNLFVLFHFFGSLHAIVVKYVCSVVHMISVHCPLNALKSMKKLSNLFQWLSSANPSQCKFKTNLFKINLRKTWLIVIWIAFIQYYLKRLIQSIDPFNRIEMSEQLMSWTGTSLSGGSETENYFEIRIVTLKSKITNHVRWFTQTLTVCHTVV